MILSALTCVENLSVVRWNQLSMNVHRMTFSEQKWKKENIVSIHKKNDRQCLENYRLVSLPPIMAKS